MSTRHFARIAIAFALLATIPIPRVFAVERMLVAQSANGEDDWRRRQKRPRPERPDQPRRPDRGQPVILMAPAIVYGLGNAGGFGDREVAPPRDYERPAARKAKPRTQASKPTKPAKSTRSTARKSPERSARPVAVAAVGPHVTGEILFATASPEATETILKRHRLTRLETVELDLTGTTIVRARVAKGSSSERTLRELRSEKTILSSELNHLFALQSEPEGAAKGDLASVQYAPAKLRLAEAHAVAEGQSILVAVIDSGIDGSHPELAGTLDPASPARTIGSHGTAIAGVIAAHQRLVSAAPKVRILAFDSFLSPDGSAARGSTLDILKSLDKAAGAGARVVNLSFAGPEDTLLSAGLAAAQDRGIVLVAAAGNGGPKAGPAFPAAHPAVIAVTATDPADAIYKSANRGGYIALAAPGVDILTTAPNGTYEQVSGTSFAAAQVSGIAALLLERQPTLAPDAVRAILTKTARDLGKPGRDDIFGAGLVDAAAAIHAVTEATASAALR
ncbi:S8 family serine peptidase [Kaistia granuli]|uniref:S8 family serine peptidase n=1 Tax=Kaistia granuli TaxID=363259 RepID=UPI000377D44C|nr:S8 family serine peptidase [Kaistia granuli]